MFHNILVDFSVSVPSQLQCSSKCIVLNIKIGYPRVEKESVAFIRISLAKIHTAEIAKRIQVGFNGEEAGIQQSTIVMTTIETKDNRKILHTVVF